MTQSWFKTLCYAIAVAMGVAVLVINLLGGRLLPPMSMTTITNLLAIGLAVIGIANLQ